MVRCSVLGCKSNSEMNIDGLSFHLFPEKPKQRCLWVAATGKKNWLPKKSSRMCCRHFHPDLIWKKGKKTYLHFDAVPNKELPVSSLASMSLIPMEIHKHKTATIENAEVKIELPESSLASTSLSPMEIHKHKTASIENAEVKIVKVYSMASTSTTPMETQKTETASLTHASEIKKNSSVKVNFLASTSTSTTPMETQQSETTTSEHATEVDNNILGESPEYSPRTFKMKCKKEQEVSQQRLTKIKTLREKTRRLVKKVAKLENELAEVQSKLLIKSEHCKLLVQSIPQTKTRSLPRANFRKNLFSAPP